MSSETLETRIMGAIMRDGPITARQLRNRLEPDMPLEDFQQSVINLHLRQTIEIAGRNSQKETLWQITRAKP